MKTGLFLAEEEIQFRKLFRLALSKLSSTNPNNLPISGLDADGIDGPNDLV